MSEVSLTAPPVSHGYRPDDLLLVATPAPWLSVALGDVDLLLIDHAGCEQKAAAAALTLLGKAPEDRVFVETLSHLAQEELRHFDLVYQLILARGGTLRTLSVDPYVRDLAAAVRKGPDGFIDRLLVAALIEARSHERFVLLAQGTDDPAVRTLYESLIPPEAGHAALFTGLAERRSPSTAAVRVRLTQLATLEAEIVLARSPEPRIHG